MRKRLFDWVCSEMVLAVTWVRTKLTNISICFIWFEWQRLEWFHLIRLAEVGNYMIWLAEVGYDLIWVAEVGNDLIWLVGHGWFDFSGIGWKWFHLIWVVNVENGLIWIEGYLILISFVGEVFAKKTLMILISFTRLHR